MSANQVLVNVRAQRHVVHTGDKLVVGLQCLRDGAVVDLTGYTCEFYAVTSAGAEVIARTAVGVAIAVPAEGKVVYQASSAPVAGTYYMYFIAIDADGHEETFPPDSKRFVLVVQDDV